VARSTCSYRDARCPGHDLPSFARYLNKVFQFRDQAQQLRDARQDPDISPQSVFLAVFHSFVFRLPSFLQLEADLAQPAFQRWIEAPRGFGDDVLRYSLCGFDLDSLQQVLVQVNRQLKRNKAFDEGRVQGRIVAALDGIEVLSSYSRCCDSCLQRRVSALDERGQPVERIQYYHRAVGCQIVSSPVKPLLAIEWLEPGEGEDTAALRLLSRLPELYGSPFFDILLLDSLYAQAPVLRLAARFGWDLAITLKQEARDLYQSATHLFQSRPPDVQFSEPRGTGTLEAQLWDTDGLPFSRDFPQPVRVLQSEEQLTRFHYRQGKRVAEIADRRWIWITTLDTRTFPARTVWRCGHARWKNENNGWNDLTQNWALKHGFLHACQHRPKRPSEAGPLQPVPNRGLAAVTLILCLAFVLSSAFALLHSKIFRLYHPTLREIGRQLYRSLWQLQPPARAPAGGGS
jgi:hypothetical protein